MLHGVCFGEEAGARNLVFSGKDNAFPGARSPLPLAGVGGHMYIYHVLCFYNKLFDIYTDTCIYIYIYYM